MHSQVFFIWLLLFCLFSLILMYFFLMNIQLIIILPFYQFLLQPGYSAKQPFNHQLSLQQTANTSLIESNHRELNKNGNMYPLNSILPHPLILGWTTEWGGQMTRALLEDNNLSNCPFNCTYSDDRSLIKNASLVLFFPVDAINGLPQYRHSDQLFTFFSSEPPTFSIWFRDKEYKELFNNGYFNATFTYLMSSDVHYIYDWFTPLDGTENDAQIWTHEQIDEKIERKSKLLFWFVSNCKTSSRRENYVTELQKHMNVTVIGNCPFSNAKNCGGHLGGTNQKEAECAMELYDSHFFYIAFENSVCNQYVTEKYWKLKHLIVPIVLAKYVFRGLEIPPNSYISADDFANPKELSDYLKRVANNKQLYMKYFEWAKHYRKTQNSPFYSDFASPLCKLCGFANRNRIERKTYILENATKFWLDQSECHPAYAEMLIQNVNKFHDGE